MRHIRFVTVQSHAIPGKASLLEVTQKVAIAGAAATALNTLATALNTYTQVADRKGDGNGA